ncbi:MAG: hypothetical protein RLZ28_767 [Actinomycetota bacterium]|jgi:hypothetical protein
MVVLLVAAIWGVVAIANGLNQTGAKPGATNSLNPASTAGSGEHCAPGAIVVTPVITDSGLKESRASFGSSEKPYFGFTLTNTGEVDCSFNVGSAEQFFTVSSGADTYWTSRDCDRSATLDKTMVLTAGQKISSQPTVWDRVRSSVDGCNAASGQAAVPAGGATFHLNVSVAGVLSDPAKGAFILR